MNISSNKYRNQIINNIIHYFINELLNSIENKKNMLTKRIIKLNYNLNNSD